jgi:hypothetical protein
MSPGNFAIVGIALGAISTYLVQSLMARRAEGFEAHERLRRERMEVYSSFASSTMEARRGQINRWYQHTDAGRDSAEYGDAKAESYRGRSVARRERYRVQLVAVDGGLTDLAERVVQSLGAVHEGATRPEMEEKARDNAGARGDLRDCRHPSAWQQSGLTRLHSG